MGLAQQGYPASAEAWRARFEDALGAGELVLVAVASAASGDSTGTVVGYARAGRRLPPGPDDPAPAGWYLAGAVVDERHRRRGAAHRMLSDLMAHAPAGEPVWSFVDSRNTASLALHAGLGFIEVLRAPVLLGEQFHGGDGVLFRREQP